MQSNGSVNWQFDATVATEVDVDYKYHEYREIENEESDADGMLTIKAGNYTRRAELVGGTDSTAQINGNGNTGVDGVGAVSNITTNNTSTNNGDTEVAIEVEIVNSDPADPYVWPSWDVFSPTQIEEMLNGMFSAPDETGNTLQGDGGSGIDGQGDEGLSNGSQFRFDDPDDPGLGSQQHLRAGKMAPNMGLNATERHLFALHGAGQMQSIFANSIPGVGAVLGGVDAVNGEDSITGEKLTYFQQGLGLLGAVPFVGGMFKSTGRVAKTTRAVDKVADAIGHAPKGKFPNQMAASLPEELAAAARVGAKPITFGAKGTSGIVNSGTIKYVVTESGELIISPHTLNGVEISHAVLSGGRPVLAAGQANIAASGGKMFGIDISRHSGHFMPLEESLAVARAAFEKCGVVFPK